MTYNQYQGPKHVRFADAPKVHTYSPDTSPSSTVSSDELRTPSDNGMLPLPSMSHYIAQCATWAPNFVPSTILVPPGYTLVGSNAPLVPVNYHVPAPAPTPTPAIPAIHPTLTRPPFQWDVRTTALPSTLTRDQAYRDEAAFSSLTTSVTLRFTTPQGIRFAHAVAGGGGSALRVVDLLRAIHDALYTPEARPRDSAVLRAAEVAEGYRSLRRDGGPYMVDLYPVSPNRVDGARLYFVGLEWGGARGEVRVLLGPGA